MSYQKSIIKVLEYFKATPNGKPNYFVSRQKLKKHLGLDCSQFHYLNKALRVGVSRGVFLQKGHSFRLNFPTKEKGVKFKNFTFSEYKNCLLVKTPKGIFNKQNVGTTYNIQSFSRPIYWNTTLSGWVASRKDRSELIKLGIKPN